MPENGPTFSTCIQSAILQWNGGADILLVETTRRTTMQGDTLNHLLEIYVEGPTLSPFCPDHAIELWWSNCSTTRRVNQQAKEEYRPQNPDPTQQQEEQ